MPQPLTIKIARLGEKACKNMYKFRNFKYFDRKFLEHPALLENPEDYGKGNDHQSHDHNPCPTRAAEETSELDIHTEEAGNQGRRHQEQGDQSEDLHDLVLVEVDDTENSVLQVLETLEAEVGMVDK